MSPTRTQKAALLILLAVALFLRLGYAFSQDHLAPYDRQQGGDTWWYLEYGYRLVTGIESAPLPTAPLYPVIVGGLRLLFQSPTTDLVLLPASPGGGLDVYSVAGAPVAAVVVLLRVLQALAATSTVYFAYRIVRALTQRITPALIVAAVLATAVALIVSTAEVQTETFYIFFLAAALMLYTDLTASHITYRQPLLWLAVCGGLLALATLTRAVLLLFPLGLLLHALLLRYRDVPTQATLRGVTLLLAVYIALNSLWTFYYYNQWGQVIVGAQGLSAFFYLGTQSEVPPPAQIDEDLGASDQNPIGADDFNAQATRSITTAPLAYLSLRAQNLLSAYAQPYGTNAFGGPSLRALTTDWLRTDRTPSGLLALTRAPAFWPKLLIYLVHYGGLLLALIGLWRGRRRWPLILPLAGLILYVTLLHLALLALPRYIFPLLPFWWSLAPLAFIRPSVHPHPPKSKTPGQSRASANTP